MSVALTTNMRRQSASARRVVKGSPAPFPAILAVGALWYLGMLDGLTPLMRPQGHRVRQHRRQTTFRPRAARRPNRPFRCKDVFAELERRTLYEECHTRYGIHLHEVRPLPPQLHTGQPLHPTKPPNRWST